MGNQLLKSYEVNEASKCDGGRYIGWNVSMTGQNYVGIIF